MAHKPKWLLIIVVTVAGFASWNSVVHTVLSQIKVPQLSYSSAKTGGCGDIFLFKQITSGLSQEVLTVSINLHAKKFDEPILAVLAESIVNKEFAEAEFDLSEKHDDLNVTIGLFHGPDLGLCDCVHGVPAHLSTWTAKKGKLIVTLHGPAGGNYRSECYLATAILNDAEFQDDRGRTVTLKKESISKAVVGWGPG